MSDATVVVGEGRVTVSLGESTSGAARERALAELAAEAAEAGQIGAELARDAAADLVLPENTFVEATIAAAVIAGEAATTTGEVFKAVGTTEGYAQVREKTALASDLLYEEVTKAGLASNDVDKGAAFITYRYPGAPAISRNIAARIRETGGTLTDFDAVAGDTGDQTAKIQDGVDTVIGEGGNRLIIPPGTFRTEGPHISFPSGLLVQGYGPLSKIHSADTSALYLFRAIGTEATPLEKITLKDFAIYGGATFTAGVPSVNNGSAIDFQFVNDCTFENLDIDGFALNGIAVANTLRPKVALNRVNRCGQSISFYSNAIDSHDILVIGNTIRNNGQFNAGHFEGSAGEALGDGMLYGVRFIGNYIDGSYGLGVNAEHCPGIVIDDNQVSNCGPGTEAGLGSGIFTFGCEAAKIRTNHVTGCDEYGIALGAGCSDSLVDGNTTRDNGDGSLLLTDSGAVGTLFDIRLGSNTFEEGDPVLVGTNVSVLNSIGSSTITSYVAGALTLKSKSAVNRNNQILFENGMGADRWRAGVDVGTNNGSTQWELYRDGVGTAMSVTVAGQVGALASFAVGGTKVIGAQGAAVADATDAATAITQLNALLARMRAHGLIA